MAKLVICPVCKQNGQRSVSSFWITQLPTPKIDGGYFDQEGNWQQPKIGWRFCVLVREWPYLGRKTYDIVITLVLCLKCSRIAFLTILKIEHQIPK